MSVPALNGLPQPSVTTSTPPAATPVAAAPAFDPMKPSTVTPPPNTPPVTVAPPSVTPATPSPIATPSVTQSMTQPNQVVEAPSTVPVAPITNDDLGWLNNLISGQPTATPATPSVAPAVTPSVAPVIAPVQTPVASATPGALPDFPTTAPANVEFIPNTTGLPAPVVPGTAPVAPAADVATAEPQGDMAKMMKMLEDLQGKQVQADQSAELKTQMDAKIAELAAQYGDSDPALMTEFKDIFDTFRAAIGKEFTAQTVNETFALKQEIAAMKATIEKMTAQPAVDPNNPAPAVQDTTIYRNTVVQAIPQYSEIVNSAYFKQLLNTPVDPHNPSYTFNHKIGNMFNAQHTQEIISFFSDVAAKLAPATVQNNQVVVDSGVPAIAGTATDSLTTEKINEVFAKVLAGEMTATEEEMLKLRQLAAQAAMRR